MRLNEFYEIAERYAPKALSDEYCERYGAYDNSGVLIDTGEEIRGALFSLDFSLAAIERAIAVGANLIVTHHPAIYGKISDIVISDFQPLGKKLVKCLKNGISVISMHLNLDGAEGGIDESLMQGVCGGKGSNVAVMQPLSKGGYGRAYDIEERTVNALVSQMKNTFSTERLAVYGDREKRVRRVASFCGGGADEAAVEFAVKEGAQAMISSDFKHHILTLAWESGLSVIALTHYASERYGFEKYYEKISQSVALPCVYHTDRELL
ncbi:MAG: Nif3-like dinuclear metal center hexameric protein [Clostridia bacterium]|nr:Nif3-like dinuclear metal center hexameric protein [Clostridia bacterium]